MSKDNKTIYYENPQTREKWEQNLSFDLGISCKIEDDPTSTGIVILFSYTYFHNSNVYYHVVEFPLEKLPENYNEFMINNVDEILKKLSIENT